MTINNGYCTSAEFFAYTSPKTSTGALTTAQVTVVENIIESASRLIDNQTRKTFYARAATNKYDVPYGNQLDIEDDWLLSVGKITNGDGVEVTAGDYILKPANSTPKYAVKLKEASTVQWEFDVSGNSEQVLSISGSWGYTSSAPMDIKEACLEIASAWYKRRFGENMSSETVVEPSGIVITPKDIPVSARSILNKYASLT
jgi:hypothetical protein